MDIVFVSGVELGKFALRAIIDSMVFQTGDVRVQRLFTLDEHYAGQTSGYVSFDELTTKAGISLQKVPSINAPSVIKDIEALAPDFIFIIGWSELASSTILDIPKRKHNSPYRHATTHGCIGIHPTLLPRGRGRAPIPWAIIKGLEKSGVTMFYLEEKADAGDIIAQVSFDITLEDTANTIYQKVAQLHYDLVAEQLPLLWQRKAKRQPQDQQMATYWKKRTPADGLINWNDETLHIYNWIRALTMPYPGAFTYWRGQKIIIWAASLIPEQATQGIYPAGQVIALDETGMRVACRDGVINLERLEALNDGPLRAIEFARRYGVAVGDLFSSEN